MGVCISVGEVRQSDCLHRMMAGEDDVAPEVIFNLTILRMSSCRLPLVMEKVWLYTLNLWCLNPSVVSHQPLAV